jgi:hypothetical protein
MTHLHKIEAWAGAILAVIAIAATLALIHWHGPRPITIRGAVLMQNADPHKQQPIGGVIISAGGLALSDTKSDPSGLFSLTLHTLIRRGHPIVLSFRDAQYRPLEVTDFVSNKLYVVHLVPVAATPTQKDQKSIKVTNVRVRYTVKAMSEVNVGSAVKTFDVKNTGNVPCNGQHPCSPEGRWKANSGSASLDAGQGNVFRDARASCIAGPCPFTRLDDSRLSQGGQVITVTALDWSDTATFLLEAEVFRSMQSQIEHWSYPVIFDEGLSFTLPSSAESVTMEADLDGNTIIFPVGPSLLFSWATCDSATNTDKGMVYRCTPKPGYTFQSN